MLESELEKKIRIDLERKGWLVNKNMLNSRPGWPDRTLVKDRVVFLELKRPGKDLTKLQRYIHKKIRAHGGEVYTANSWESYLALNL